LQTLVLLPQAVAALGETRIHRDTGHRTDLDTLRLVEMADTFSTSLRIDLVYLWPRKNGQIRALRFADIAVDALVGDHQSHRATLAVLSVIMKPGNMQNIIGDAVL
jgi:hypothetical protein